MLLSKTITSSILDESELSLRSDDDVVSFWVEHRNSAVQAGGQAILGVLLAACDMSGVDDSSEFIGKRVSEADWETLKSMASRQRATVHRRTARRERSAEVRSTPTIIDTKPGRYVYVISCTDTDLPLSKIGIAGSPETRLKQLSTSSPHSLRLELARYAENAREIEAEAHNHFGARRCNGEWFSIGASEAITYVNAAISGRIAA